MEKRDALLMLLATMAATACLIPIAAAGLIAMRPRWKHYNPAKLAGRDASQKPRHYSTLTPRDR